MDHLPSPCANLPYKQGNYIIAQTNFLQKKRSMFQAVYLRMHLHELFELLLPVRIEACGTETSYILYTQNVERGHSNAYPTARD